MRWIMLIAATTWLAVFSATSHAQSDRAGSQSATLGDALSAMAKAKRPAAEKAALQRSQPGRDFFQVIEDRKKHLQIALVLDGTQSMDLDIQSAVGSIRSVVDHIKSEEAGGKLELSLIVYRDTFSRDPALEDLKEPISPWEGIPFTEDIDAIHQALGAIQTRTGQPYFEEPVDLGIHAALDQLNWEPMENKDVTRWVLVCGDAPPFYVGNVRTPLDEELRQNAIRAEELWKSGRFVSNDQLVELAKNKGVNLLSVLCSARANLPDSDDFNRNYQKFKPYAVEFFSDVSDRTGGKLLDLSDPETIQYLASKGRQARLERETQAMALITEQEIELKKSENTSNPREVVPQLLRLAVLPHVPFEALGDEAAWQRVDQIDDPLQIGLQVAIDLREKLERMNHLQLTTFQEAEKACRSAYSRSRSPKALAARVATILGADYVVWGVYREVDGQAQLSSGLYEKLDGALFAAGEESVDAHSDQARLNLANAVLNELLRNAYQQRAQGGASSEAEVATLQAAAGIEGRIKRQEPLSENLTANRYLLYGLKSLEDSLQYYHFEEGYVPGEIQHLLTGAITDFRAAIEFDQSNPTPYLFMASAYYNLAIMGGTDDAMTEYFKALEMAYNFREEAHTAEISTEIEADYALIITKDIRSSVAKYQALTAGDNGRANSALRAHWMLAGIYSGDWGIDKLANDAIDLEKARDHILEILAFWPNSPEARYFHDYLYAPGSGALAVAGKGVIPLTANVLLEEAGR